MRTALLLTSLSVLAVSVGAARAQQPEPAELAVHDGGHVVNVPLLVAFLERHLAKRSDDASTSNSGGKVSP